VPKIIGELGLEPVKELESQPQVTDRLSLARKLRVRGARLAMSGDDGVGGQRFKSLAVRTTGETRYKGILLTLNILQFQRV
jgi:hypothetical protein